MATPVRELVTLWGFDVDMKPLEKLDQSITTIKGALTQIGLTAIAAGGTIFGFAKFTANAGDEALKMSQKVGVSVEALQELSFAAKLADVSQEQLQVGLTQLSRKALDAGRGNQEATRSFSELGVSLRDSNGRVKNTDTLLLELSDKFSKIPDGVRKTGLAMELFGRSGAELIPFFNQGSAGIAKLRQEARDLGVVLDTETAKASEEFNDNLTRLFSALTGVRNIIGASLIPVINDIVVELKKFILANRELITQNLGQFVQTLSFLFQNMLKILSELLRIVNNLSQLFGGLNNAIRIATIAISAFLAVKMAYGIGQMVLSLGQLTFAFATMGRAALLAQIQLLAIPLAIFAVIAAIALLVEDFLVFQAGGDSVIGLAIKSFGTFFETIKSGAAVVMEVISAILSPIKAVNAYLGETSSKISSIFTSGLDKVSSFFGFNSEGIAAAGQTFAGGATAALNPFPSSFSQNSTTINQRGHLTVDVQGLAPDVAQQVAQTSMTNAFESILRETGRDAESAVER